jgi:hypothetical protein
MKHVWLILILSVAALSLQAQLKMNASGKVSIGSIAPSTNELEILGITRINNPSYNNHLIIHNAGGSYSAAIYPANNNTCCLGKSDKKFNYIYTMGISTTSDRRQKENIKEVKNALDYVLKMQAVKYDIKKEYSYFDLAVSDPNIVADLDKERKNKFGFIAQDLEKVLPEVINYDDSTDIYGINYIEIIPILAQAIKEQQELILKLEKKISDYSSGEKSAGEEIIDPPNGEAMLGKNIPNPFNENTYIMYFLPETVGTAFINIYDLQGKQIKSIAIGERGEGTITISGSELQPGIYVYCLLADKQLIGSEQMILTE